MPGVRDMVRYAHALSFIAGFLLAVAILHGGAQAKPAVVPGDTPVDVTPASTELSDGISVLNAYKRRSKGKRNRFIDKVTGTLPPRASNTGLTPVTPDMDPSLLDSKDVVFIKNQSDSIGYISKDRLKRGLEALAREVTNVPDDELKQTWQEAKDLLPWWAGPLLIPIEASGNLRDAIRTLLPGLVAGELADDEEMREAARQTVKSKPPKPPKPPTSTAKPPKPPAGTKRPTTTVTPAPPPAPAPPNCTGEQAKLASARGLVSSGDLGTAETVLNSVDTVKCPALLSQVTAAQQQIADKVNDLNTQAATAASSCDKGAIESAATALSGVSHPGLTGDPNTLSRRASALGSAQSAFDSANESFKGKQWGSATSQLEGVIAQMSADGIQNCPPYDRAANGITKINGLVDNLIAQANSAATSCSQDKISAMRTRLESFSHPRLDGLPARLEAAAEKCRRKNRPTQVSEWDRSCKDRYGEHSYSSRHGADGINICKCHKPYVKSFYGTKCVPPDQVMAEADAQCQEEFGPGSYADPVKSSYKTNVCHCGRGTTWNCGKKRCVPRGDFLRAMREHVTKLCRAQYGNRVTKVNVFANCRYNCTVRTASPRTTSRTPSRRTTTTRRPVHDKGLSVIIGVIGVISRMPQPQQRTRTPPSRKCHHQRTTSRQHCGSN